MNRSVVHPFSEFKAGSPISSPKIRKIDYNKLKLICTMALVNMAPEQLMEFAIEIIKKAPKDRIPEEVLVLIKATETMQYFKELNKKSRHIRSSTHEKICSKILYEHVRRGVTVMHYGDAATKFYIILRGSVSIYVPRDFMVLQKEIEDRKKNPQANLTINVLQKIFQWRQKLKEFVYNFPLDESENNRNAFKKLYNKASIQLNPNIIKLLTKDLKINHDFFFYSSIINLKRASMAHDNHEVLQNLNLQETILEEDDNNESPKSDEETDFLEEKAKLENENLKDFLQGFNEVERPILSKLQSFLGEVPLISLDEPESYFQDGVFKFHLVGVFGPGSIFGEVGLLMRKPRSASVICNSDTNFAILTAEDYAGVLDAVDRKEMETRMEFFIENLFQELQPEVANRLSYMFKKSKLMKGNYIYKQGDKSNDVFLIKKGEIQIYKKIKESEQEKKIENVKEFIKTIYHQNENKIKQDKFVTIHLSKLGFGQSFGEDDIVYNRNRAYNAVCSSNKVTLFHIPKAHFLKIITENKKIQFKILKNIKIKEKWHTQQITNFYSKRQNQQENTGLNSPNNFNQIRRNINEIPELSKIQPKKTISSPKTITFLKITSPNFKSQINSMRTSPMLSPKNINKSKLLMNLQNRSIYKPKVFFNNIVIRREQNSNNSEVILNRSITEIVEKNDKTLEELLKYSNTFKKPNDFYKLLTEDEEKATKEAKILYLHKSKRKNYSNSDSLDSNQKISLKSIINSLKKNVENEELSQKKCFRRFSIDILQRKTPLKQQTAYQRSYQKQFLGNIDSKSPVKDMLKVNFQNRGTANKKKDLRIETARDKIASENFHFFVPITSRQILSKNSLLRKYSKK